MILYNSKLDWNTLKFDENSFCMFVLITEKILFQSKNMLMLKSDVNYTFLKDQHID